MTFDFYKFYDGLLNRKDYFDNYWDQFPSGRLLRFKRETLSLIQENIKSKDGKGLQCTLAIIFYDGADKDFTDLLLFLLDQKWHILEEDIVEILELIKDPKSINKLYELAVDVPDYDDMRALAKKCMSALSAIGTNEARERLLLLMESNDPIIRENATFQLENLSS